MLSDGQQPGPEGWGWTMIAGEGILVWSILSSITTACKELVAPDAVYDIAISSCIN